MKSQPSFVVRRAKRREYVGEPPWLVVDLKTMSSETYASRSQARAAARQLNINEQKKCVPSHS